MYVDIIDGLDILGTNKLFLLGMVWHGQLCLEQLDSKILETPITLQLKPFKKSFGCKVIFLRMDVSIRVTYQYSFLSRLCQGMPKIIL